MPVAQKSATIFSMPVGVRLAGRALGELALNSERALLADTSNAPHDVWSPGIGLAASHLALA